MFAYFLAGFTVIAGLRFGYDDPALWVSDVSIAVPLLIVFIWNELSIRNYQYLLDQSGVHIQVNGKTKFHAWQDFASFSVPRMDSAEVNFSNIAFSAEQRNEQEEVRLLAAPIMPLAKKMGRDTIVFALGHPRFLHDKSRSLTVVANDDNFDQALQIVQAHLSTRVPGAEIKMTALEIIFIICLASAFFAILMYVFVLKPLAPYVTF